MRFERVAKYKNDTSIHLPNRATKEAAGYDFEVSEQTLVPSYLSLMKKIPECSNLIMTFEQAQTFFKENKIKPTLVPTGIKAQIDNGFYLQLNVRSSLPLKSWLVLANGSGIIDGDYYSNPSNDGEIMFQLINLAPFDILLNKGDKIGQGIFLPYMRVEGDHGQTAAERIGGFGSSD